MDDSSSQTNPLSTNYRVRIYMVMALFSAFFAAIGVRLVILGNMERPDKAYAAVPPSVARPDIVDRNNVTLAMDVASRSVYAEPRRIIDVDEAAEGLTSVFPDLDMIDIHKRLASNSGFTWIKRGITPAEKDRLWALGIPGVGIRDETRRLYPNGPAAAHVLGSVNIDNAGIAGIERWIDEQGLQDLRSAGLNLNRRNLEPIVLSLDLRVQYALSDELRKAVTRFEAIAGAGLVMDVTNGEVLALVSLPDFDPNIPADALKPDRINRVSVGTYEMGSTFKAMTTAMALDSGVFNIHSVLDASQPLRFGRFSINDYRGQGRPLFVPEAFIYSSNIAMARMAMGVGVEKHKAFLRRLGQFDRLVTELPENAQPLIPPNWSEISTATIAFGHGMAVTPLQASMAISAIVNGGRLIRPTFIEGTPVEKRILATDVVTPQTGEAVRFLMRLNAEVGSAKKADVAGYFIGGKTGTSEKVVNGAYSGDRVLTAFMGIVPADKPRYLFLTILDEPKGLPETSGFRTSGWNAVPVTGTIMARVLPFLPIAPQKERPANPFPTMVRIAAWGSERFQPLPPEPTLPALQTVAAPSKAAAE
ncbi:penicillin-binding protein 2 [Mesorhizobium qingshengii]|uniref:Penicillin-binding protein 2 n=1 Tax=Mesorhizobium qingshengii TaxID=1165689 RepID=A0ABT4R2W8_9HYPH|nr:penicillin-binding protein 2 [Mesorhizobium qingshengii]MCZ8547903.1 penicillin-binding protein 2 [Mesorhizobium qingshengii]